MARPIAETPILTGSDAERFTSRMREVENMSAEQRAENTRRLKKSVDKAKRQIRICF